MEYQIDRKNQEIVSNKAAHIAAEQLIEQKNQKQIEVIKEDTKKELQQIVDNNLKIVEDFE